MKELLLILFLISNLSISAQIKYIEPSNSTGSSLAVVVDEVPLAHTAQFLPLDKNGKLVGKGNLTRQVSQVFDNISAAFKEANSRIDNVVKINVCITQSDLMSKVQNQLNGYFKTGKKPAVSFVVGNLAHTDALLAMDAIATSTLRNEKAVKYFRSDALFNNSMMSHVSVLPRGSVVYVSGQAVKGDLAEATRGTLKQLEETLGHLGLKKEHIIQIKSFFSPASDVKIVEKEMSGFFSGGTIPPLVYIDWLSKDPIIEIELIAASPEASSSAKEQLDFITPPGMTQSPVYSRVTRINYGKKVYVSALYGKSPNDSQAQVTEIFTSLTSILKKAGSDMNHLVKATYYVSDDKSSTSLNELRPKYYDSKRPPAASKAMVKEVGLTGRDISVDMIGIVADNGN